MSFPSPVSKAAELPPQLHPYQISLLPHVRPNNPLILIESFPPPVLILSFQSLFATDLLKVIESFPEPVIKEATLALATKILFPSPRSKEESDPSKTLTISFPDPETT